MLNWVWCIFVAWSTWALGADSAPVQVGDIQIVITHILPNIPPEKAPTELQNPFQGPNATTQSENFFPEAHWGMVTTDTPHLAGQIVLHDPQDRFLVACDVTVLIHSAGVMPSGVLYEPNQTLEISSLKEGKVKDLLGRYKGFEFGLSLGAGVKHRMLTHETRNIELSDTSGEFLALGLHLGRSSIQIAPRGGCYSNTGLGWLTPISDSNSSKQP